MICVPQRSDSSGGNDETTPGAESQNRWTQQDHTAVCRSRQDPDCCWQPCFRGGLTKNIHTVNIRIHKNHTITLCSNETNLPVAADKREVGQSSD